MRGSARRGRRGQQAAAVSILNWLAAVVIALAGTTWLAAQTATATGTVFVSAVDRKGEPVADLGVQAFEVREDGRPREVFSVERSTEPSDIVVFVDNSAASVDRFQYIRSGIKKFIEAVTPGNKVALVAIAERPIMIADYSNDASALAGRLDQLMPTQGEMALLDSVLEVSRAIAAARVPRANLVAAITDGPERTTRSSEQVVAALKASGATLDLVLLGNRFAEGAAMINDQRQFSARERSFFVEDGPSATGGRRIQVLTQNGIEDAIARLGRELASQYKVVYHRTDATKEPKKVEVKSKAKDVSMRAFRAR